MSMFDKAKDLAAEHSDKVKDLSAEHGDKIEEYSDQGIQRAGDFAESRGVDADKVTQGEKFLDGKVGDGGADGTAP